MLHLNSLPVISPESLRTHVEFLGHDSLEGRGTGMRGGELAAQYLTAQCAKLGLQPRGDDGSFTQAIALHGSRPSPQSRLQVVTKNGEITLALNKDYLLYNSGAETFVPKPVPLVFVGYGITAPEFDYNDYQTMEVEGKIVVFLSGEPASRDKNYFAGEAPTYYSFPTYKQMMAIGRGARGSIMIPLPRDERGRTWDYWARQFAFEDVTLLSAVTNNLSIMMNPQAAELLFEGAAYSLHEVFELDTQQAMRSFSLKTSASFRGVFQQRDFLAHNIIGRWEGGDPASKDAYVLLTAHYDHLGLGPAVQGDSIYNGVFDNAIGVAAVLEIARAITALPERPRRSLLFLFLTGEEKGMLGSNYYVEHPSVPLHRTIANINVDGLALFDTFNDITGVGAEFSSLEESLGQVAAALGLRVSPVPPDFAATQPFARSDQVVFAQAGIPALLLMEGIDYRHTLKEEGWQRFLKWGEQFYHTPADDLRQPLNFAAAQQHAQVLFALAYYLASSSVGPEWNPGTPFIHARLQTLAEER
ncbi:MAG: M28 family peptidase [bacterium]